MALGVTIYDSQEVLVMMTIRFQVSGNCWKTTIGDSLYTLHFLKENLNQSPKDNDRSGLVDPSSFFHRRESNE